MANGAGAVHLVFCFVFAALQLTSGCVGESTARPMSSADQKAARAKLAGLEERATELQAAAHAYLESTELSFKDEPIIEEVKFAQGTCMMLRNYVFFTQMHRAESFKHNLKLIRESPATYDSMCVPLDSPVVASDKGAARYEGELASARAHYTSMVRLLKAREEFAKELRSASVEITDLLYKCVER